MPTYKVEYSYHKKDVKQVEEWRGQIEFPSSIKVLCRYAYAAAHAGFVVVSTRDHEEIHKFSKPYRHIVDFVIQPLKPFRDATNQ